MTGIEKKFLTKDKYESAPSIELNITYGVENEIWYAQATTRKIPWFLEQGYPSANIKVPAGVTDKSNNEEVKEAVIHEYADSDYVECAAEMQKKWTEISRGFDEMRKNSSMHLKNGYEIVLTKYGSGGSYNANKDLVIARIDVKRGGGPIGVVVHEIIHMTIQYLIDQHHIRHWQKERLVDLLTERYFSDLNRGKQNTKEDVSMVNSAFERYFPDMEEVTRSIKSGNIDSNVNP